MFEASASLYHRALKDLDVVASGLNDEAVDRIVQMIAQARHVAVYGAGREGLQIRGFAMRLFHLGRSVSVVGDMTMPPLGAGDLFLVTTGPGELPTASALASAAKSVGARVVVITAQPKGTVPAMADEVLLIPAQTMADDRGRSATLLPMGSLYEGALFILFEVMVLKLMSALSISAEAMRANHTNVE